MKRAKSKVANPKVRKPNNLAAAAFGVSDFLADARESIGRKSFARAVARADEIRFTEGMRSMRQSLGIRQEDIKEMEQEAVSRFERQADARVSTCKRYLRGMNYRLVSIAVPVNGKGDSFIIDGEDAVELGSNSIRFPARLRAVSSLSSKRRNA